MKFKNIILSLFSIGLISTSNAAVLDNINQADLKKLEIHNLPPLDSFKNNKNQKEMLNILYFELNKYQYLKQKIDLDFANKFLNVYLEKLDRNKLIFLKSDINDILEEYSTKENNPITSKKHELAYQIYYLYLIRKAEALQVKLNYLDSLKNEPNLNTNIKLYNLKDHLNREELNKRLKNEVLNDLINLKINNINEHNRSKIKPLENTKNKKKEKNKQVPIKSFKQIKDDLTKKYKVSLRKISNSDLHDAFTTYFDAIANSGDYRTSWNGPGKDPKTSNGLIGISYKEVDGEILITAVSGAAKETKKIESGDILLGIGNDSKNNIKYFSNYSSVRKFFNDVSAKAGVKSYLELKRDNGKPFIVELIRKERKNDDDDEEGSVEITEYKGENGKILSFVSTNDFYWDFGKDARNAVKNGNYKGIIIDLRNNGGGYVYAAKELASAFVPIGTTVSIAKYGNDKYAKIQNEKTKQKQLFNGALFLLQNSDSASASEMTAGWVHDLKRGYILGDDSFGKGTIQISATLGYDWYNSSLKKTIGKFYGPLGNGNQLKPWKPTIYFAQSTGNPYKDYEINNTNPAPGGSIKSYKYAKPFKQYVTDDITKKLIIKADQLKKENKFYQAYEKYSREIKKEWVDYKIINFKERINYKNKLAELYLNVVNIQRKESNKPLYKNYYQIPKDFELKDIEQEISFKLLDYYIGLLEDNKKSEKKKK